MILMILITKNVLYRGTGDPRGHLPAHEQRRYQGTQQQATLERQREPVQGSLHERVQLLVQVVRLLQGKT